MSDVRGAAPQPRPETSQDPREVWRVQLDNGEIRAMTLDERDAAFDEGVISESTPVLAPISRLPEPAWPSPNATGRQ